MDFCDLLIKPPRFPGGVSALKKSFIYESNYIQMLLERLLCNRLSLLILLHIETRIKTG